MNNPKSAQILIGIMVNDASDKQVLADSLKKHGYTYSDLSQDETTKEHIRHMVGGHVPTTMREHFYEVIFPERPRALVDFLATIGSQWNISLFHYRSSASDSGRVLIGLQADDVHALEAKLSATGFEWRSIAPHDKALSFVQ